MSSILSEEKTPAAASMASSLASERSLGPKTVLLLATRGELYIVSANLTVVRSEGMACIGSGRIAAYPVMDALLAAGIKPARKRIDGREETQVDVGETVERIRHKLLDLTLRNKLLSYQERVRSIRIVDELPDAVFHDLVEARRGFEFLPAEGGEESAIDLSPELPEAPADPEAVAPKHSDRFLQTSLAAGRLDLRLRELAAEARRAIEETGSNTLYLAFGFLHWQDKASGKDARAPLILLPVTLRRTRVRRGDTVRYKYVLSSSEEDLEENLCLAEKLLRDFDLVLPYLYKTSEGARMLRAYLEYARDTRASAVRQDGEKRPANAFQRALVDFLAELGYEAHVDVGVSGCFLDLAVLDPERPGEYLLGILSDGPHYRRAACSRDRDRLRHEVLRRLGWRLVSIVTSDWFKNRERNRQLLVQELARHGGRSAPRSQAHSASPNKRT